MAGGVIVDKDGNAFAGITDNTTLNFNTIASGLVLIKSRPSDDAIAIPVDKKIELEFSENVEAGIGNIIISDGVNNIIIDITDHDQIKFRGKKVTIDLDSDLLPNTNYHIEMASGVIVDKDGNAFAGITDNTTFNFNTIPSEPILIKSKPSDDATAVSVNKKIELEFSEDVEAGIGNIIISDGVNSIIIDITDHDQIKFKGKKVTIDLDSDLLPNTNYHIEMASGVIVDKDGNAFAGIANGITPPVNNGGSGADILAITDLSFSPLDGGTGTDTLRFDTPLNLDLRLTPDNAINSIEIIDLSADGGDSILSLNITDLLNLSEIQTVSDSLVIHGDVGDVGDAVNLDNNSTSGQVGTWVESGSHVYEFTAADAGIGLLGTVTIDMDVTVTIIT